MAPTVPLTVLRLAGRISVNFVLEQVEIGRIRDMTDDLILLTIVQTNVEPLSREPDLQRAYATIDKPPPDELRRPVSISAVSNALRLPYETVRRRVTQMAAEGVCEITPRGVYVSSRGLASPLHCQLLETNYEKVRLFYRRLREIGFLPPHKAIVEPWRDPQPPVRAVARISSDYFLRLMEPLTQNLGDLVRGLILLAIARANTEGLTDAERGTNASGVTGYVDDTKRKPVSVAALSSRLDIPQETVRRHVAHLLDSGRCVRMRGGVVMPAAEYTRPETIQVMLANHIHLQRMVAQLAQLGVLDGWERDPANEHHARDWNAEPA
jgi:DNA-binding Lrp family transcriptional regulator